MSAYTNKLATAVCAAMGVPARFAAEKEPVSPTLRGSLREYMSTLPAESLERIAVHGPKMSREAAQFELHNRATK